LLERYDVKALRAQKIFDAQKADLSFNSETIAAIVAIKEREESRDW